MNILKNVIMMVNQEYIYILSDNPKKFSRKHREWIITNRNIINYLNRIPQNILSNSIQLDKYLLKILRHYRHDYLPISGHEYLPIAKIHPEINQLTGLHKIIYQKVNFEHLPVYLLKVKI